MLRACAVLLLGLCAASQAVAQVVRGTVRDESGAGLPGVFVMLMDSAGQMRGGVLTDERGGYVMRAPAAGTYTVRAERIGHRSADSGPVPLTADAARTLDMRVAVAAIALAPVEVESRTRCVARPRSGQRTAQLWEEVRKALTVARWVDDQQNVQFSARRYTRVIDAASGRITSEGVSHDVTRSLPYAAIEADTLAKYGFARNDGTGLVFYGPDADVLLSDAFVEGHCFHSVDGKDENQGLVGLTFRPIPGSRLPDIEGVLWLDRASLELRHIEYGYTNIARAYRSAQTGGRTEFQRLASGAWIVSRWFIRLPTAVAGGLARADYRVITLHEEGGEVLRVRDETTDRTVARGGVIGGVVYDSVAGRGLADALVYLSGTAHQARTDEAGRFELRNVPAGRYTISFAHTVLDSLPGVPAAQVVDVGPVDTARVRLAIGTVGTQLATLCPGYQRADRTSSTAVLFGYVRDERARGVAGAAIAVQGRTLRATTRTDASGYYVLCNVPLDGPFEVKTEAADRQAVARMHITGLPFRRLDLTLRD